MMRFLITRLGIYLLAVIVGYLLASIIATQSVVSSLAEMGVAVGFSDRMGMTLKDIAGMTSLFLPMIAFAYLAAFLIAAMICRWWATWRTPIYIVAGAAAVIAVHLTLNLAFNVTPFAVARTNSGLLLQGLAGAAGGHLYILLTPRKAL
jgi:hypothetical protein